MLTSDFVRLPLVSLPQPSTFFCPCTNRRTEALSTVIATHRLLPRMTGPRRCQDLLDNLVQLAKWSWLALFIPLYSPAKGHSFEPVSALDSSPRAALVTLAHESDLAPLLSSMSQLEDSFNNRYNYDWVFFGVETLSDRFRQLTSNATAATCIYEVARQNDVEPRRFNNVCHSQAESRQISIQAPSPTRGDSYEPLQTIRQIQRWNNGPFAKEKRLQTYDWFWRIEPGVGLCFCRALLVCNATELTVHLGSVHP